MLNKKITAWDPGIPVIDVETGEVKVSGAVGILCARALGSCVAVMAHDPVKKAGGMAHIMLPGRAGDATAEEKNRYAEDAIDDLLEMLAVLGAKNSGLKVGLVGGADLVGDGNIHVLVRESVLSRLQALEIKPVALCLGGKRARSAWLDIASGKMYLKEENDAVSKL